MQEQLKNKEGFGYFEAFRLADVDSDGEVTEIDITKLFNNNGVYHTLEEIRIMLKLFTDKGRMTE